MLEKDIQAISTIQTDAGKPDPVALDQRERDMIRAALTLWQGCGLFSLPKAMEMNLRAIASNGGAQQPLSTEEINTLCAKLSDPNEA